MLRNARPPRPARATVARPLGASLFVAALAGLGAATTDNVTPGSGAYGVDVTVTGSGFGVKKPKVALVPTAGGKARALRVVSFSDTQLVARLGAAPAGTYDVVVDPKDRALANSTSAAAFEVVLPTGQVFAPTTPAPNGEVTLTAQGLGTKRGSVKVGSVAAKVLSWDGATVRFKLGRRTKPGAQTVTVKTPAGTATFAGALNVTVGGGGGGGFGGPIVGNPWSGASPGMSYKVNGVFDSIDSALPVHEAFTVGATNTRIQSLRSGFRMVEIHLDRSAPLPAADQTKPLAPPKVRFSLSHAGNVWATSADPTSSDLLAGAAIDFAFTGEPFQFGGFGARFSATLVKVSGTGADTVEITEGNCWVSPK